MPWYPLLQRVCMSMASNFLGSSMVLDGRLSVAAAVLAQMSK
jgi:hypothetical protein